MICTRPKTITVKQWFFNEELQTPQFGYQITVPCGHCPACISTRQKQWFVRLKFEAERYPNKCSFITLTYDDDHLPADNSVHKDVFQKFIKRLRKYIGKTKIRYFGCGEYGDLFGRPHYHAIIFGLDPSDCIDYVKDAWTFGFVQLSPVSDARLNYVIEYLQKSLDVDYSPREKPFNLCSKGFGLDVFLDNEDLYLSKGYLSIDGHRMSMPRYYRNNSKFKDLPPDFHNYSPDELRQMEINFKKRLSLFKKNGKL